ncbi:hypothetical protein [Bacillus nitroreducens]
MNMYFKIVGLIFIVWALFILVPFRKEFTNLDDQILHRTMVKRWLRRLKTFTFLTVIGSTLVIIGPIFS